MFHTVLRAAPISRACAAILTTALLSPAWAGPPLPVAACQRLPYLFQAGGPRLEAQLSTISVHRLIPAEGEIGVEVATPAGTLSQSGGRRSWAMVTLDGPGAPNRPYQNDIQDDAVLLRANGVTYAIMDDGGHCSKLNKDETGCLTGTTYRVVWSFETNVPVRVCRVKGHIRDGLSVVP